MECGVVKFCEACLGMVGCIDTETECSVSAAGRGSLSQPNSRQGVCASSSEFHAMYLVLAT